jgi:hypothetical protein
LDDRYLAVSGSALEKKGRPTVFVRAARWSGEGGRPVLSK